jgi:hypothetical protein
MALRLLLKRATVHTRSTLCSAASWTSSHLKAWRPATRRLRRQRELQALLLAAIRLDLVPLLQAQQETLEHLLLLPQIRLQLATQEQSLKELHQLMLETLQATQPNPLQEIAQRIGLPLRQT